VRVAVTGSHGLIGRHLIAALTGGGHQVVRVVRGSPGNGGATAGGGGSLGWDPGAGRLDRAALDVDAVVHLAGVPIAGRRWNAAHKRAVRDSRVQGTSLLAAELAARPDGHRPAVFVSASAVGFYGDRKDEVLTETSPPGEGFLADVCRAWEEAARPAADAGVRTVCLRTGIVQAGDGGALGPQLPLFKAGLGARLGSGRQWVSWVSIDDEVGAILHALTHDEVTGPVNVVAPAPVTNAAYTRALARVLGRPAVLSVPAAALRLALGAEMADQMLLASQRVVPEVLARTGYDWRHPQLEPALRHLLGRKAPS
jgi:uncharacterized protein (TIGR01777 family)